MTNTIETRQAAVIAELRTFGLRPRPSGLSYVMIAGCCHSLSEAQSMISRYRRAAIRRAAVSA